MGGPNWSAGLENLSQGLGAVAGIYARREDMAAEAERQARRDAANRDFERAMQTERITSQEKTSSQALEATLAERDLARTERQDARTDAREDRQAARSENAADRAAARQQASEDRNRAITESGENRALQAQLKLVELAEQNIRTIQTQEEKAREVYDKSPKGSLAKPEVKDQEYAAISARYADRYKAAQEKLDAHAAKLEKMQGAQFALDSGKTDSGGEPTRLAIKVGDYKTPQELEAEIVKQVSGSPVDPMVVGEAIRESGLYKDLPEMTAALHRVRDAVKPGTKAAPAPTPPPAAAPAAPERTTAPAIPPPKPTAAAPAGKPEAVAAREPNLIEGDDAWMQDQANMRAGLASLPAKSAGPELITEDSALPKTVVAQVNAAGLDPSDSREAAKKKLVAAGMTEQQFAAFWKDIQVYLNKGTLTG